MSLKNKMKKDTSGLLEKALPNAMKIDSVERFEIKQSDIDAILTRNITELPLQYGHAFDANLTMLNAGVWELHADGSQTWQLEIESEGAHAIRVHYDTFILPEGATFDVSSVGHDMRHETVTSDDLLEGITDFATPLTPGDHILLEYHQPADVQGSAFITVGEIIHDVLDVHDFSASLEDDCARDETRDCGENVACSSADAWQDQVNSVIYLEIGAYICSAALINNTAQDLTPYVLTAWHCVEPETPGQHNNFTFYFNHESSTCSGSSGSYDHFKTGSYLQSATSWSSSDFALLEMDFDPDTSWDPYFAGWSRLNLWPTIGAGIHHPDGDHKQINYDNDQASSCGWNSSGTHWCVNFDDGGVMGGSSGSPVFNEERYIVGQLTGADVIQSDCSPNGNTYYGKFSTSWSNSSSSSGNLKDWLDPGDTGVSTLDGTYNGIIIYGCTDSDATNYNPEATDDNSSCIYEGCMDMDACNYDLDADINDDSCTYAQEGFDCEGNCILLGDVTLDFQINVADILIVISFVLGSTEFTDQQFFLADVNADLDVNVTDIVAIVNIILSNEPNHCDELRGEVGTVNLPLSLEQDDGEAAEADIF